MPQPPAPEQRDGRWEAARAYQWAAEIVTVALTMVAPPLAGYFLSRWLGGPRWQVVWISAGAALGFWLGLRQLLRIARTNSWKTSNGRDLGRRPEPQRGLPQPEDESRQDRTG
jgi:hypothetical protein